MRKPIDWRARWREVLGTNVQAATESRFTYRADDVSALYDTIMSVDLKMGVTAHDPCKWCGLCGYHAADCEWSSILQEADHLAMNSAHVRDEHEMIDHIAETTLEALGKANDERSRRMQLEWIGELEDLVKKLRERYEAT